MATYEPNHVKRDPVSGCVAIRTIFDESIPQLVGMAWLVATQGAGAYNAATNVVEGWDDLYVPGVDG